MSDFCNIYAMNNERRASLLGLVELGPDDHAVGKLLHREFLDRKADKIVDGFYDYLLSYNDFSQLLEVEKIPLLKKTQSDYVRSFGIDFDTSQYFDHRLRVGLAHKKVGLTLGLYQCAYRQLQQLMLDEIPSDFLQDGISSRDFRRFIHKVTALDMTLAIETYHNAYVTDMQDRLDDVHVEKDELHQKVSKDSLTGLFSRDYGLAMLKRHLNEEEAKKELSLIMADIDFFKSVNDTYGHLAGDEVLRQIGALLKSAVRDFDAVCRFGGEEFILILCHSTQDVVLKVAQRIRMLVSNNIVHYDDKDIRVTISQGIAVARLESDTMQLINEADMALYEAKQQGRDCIVMSGEDVIRD